MICQVCGANNPDNNNFCGSCGAKLSDASVTKSISPKKSNKGNGLAIASFVSGVIALATLIVIGFPLSLFVGGLSTIPCLIVGIVAAILGGIARNRDDSTSTWATLGVILGIVTIVICSLFTTINVIIYVWALISISF